MEGVGCITSISFIISTKKKNVLANAYNSRILQSTCNCQAGRNVVFKTHFSNEIVEKSTQEVFFPYKLHKKCFFRCTQEA